MRFRLAEEVVKVQFYFEYHTSYSETNLKKNQNFTPKKSKYKYEFKFYQNSSSRFADENCGRTVRHRDRQKYPVIFFNCMYSVEINLNGFSQ